MFIKEKKKKQKQFENFYKITTMVIFIKEKKSISSFKKEKNINKFQNFYKRKKRVQVSIFKQKKI